MVVILENKLKTIKSKDYKWFENGDYNLNIVGVRNLIPTKKD